MTPALPTAPSVVANNVTTPAAPPAGAAQAYPSLTGRWRASGRVEMTRTDIGGAPRLFTCSGMLDVTAQDAAAFTGQFGTQGGGFNSDRFCTASGTFRGELAGGGGASARLETASGTASWPRPSVSPSCELVSSDGVWTGSADGSAIRLQTNDVLRCPENLDGGTFGIPLATFTRTVTLTFERW